MPYHSPNGRNHQGDWDHHGYHGGHDHHGVTFYTAYGWAGYPYWPWWGWNYPILPASWDYWGDYDSQAAYNSSASQYPEYMPGPGNNDPYDQPEPQQPEYTPWPYSSPTPPAPAAPVPEAPVTLVFKDGRPNERIQNYLLTAKTLSVLDLNRREIPVDQIDLAATARVNRAAGVDFALPAQPN
jgi:hypothetical protein